MDAFIGIEVRYDRPYHPIMLRVLLYTKPWLKETSVLLDRPIQAEKLAECLGELAQKIREEINVVD